MTEAVTFEQAKAFLEDATRNWSGLLKLNRGDISDTAQALAREARKALIGQARLPTPLRPTPTLSPVTPITDSRPNNNPHAPP